jgi:mono/diheme cytochrome c family protein
LKLSLSLSELILAAVVLAGIGVAGWQLLGSGTGDGSAHAKSVTVPDFSPVALAGRAAFDANCAQCHGKNGIGTEQGPPLVNDIYNPGHHPDASFESAVRRGVPKHHWPFGDMPAQPQVTDEQVTQIVRYVRELQQANGIVYREHRM